VSVERGGRNARPEHARAVLQRAGRRRVECAAEAERQRDERAGATRLRQCCGAPLRRASSGCAERHSTRTAMVWQYSCAPTKTLRSPGPWLSVSACASAVSLAHALACASYLLSSTRRYSGGRQGGGAVRQRTKPQRHKGSCSARAFLVRPQRRGLAVQRALIVGLCGPRASATSEPRGRQETLCCCAQAKPKRAHRATRSFARRPRTAQQALDGQQDGADVVHRAPLLLENVKTYVAVLQVHVWVEAPGRLELDHWSCERVVARKIQRQLEGQTLVHLRSAAERSRAQRVRRVPSTHANLSARTVPAPPWMVPTHAKMLSPSGKAEMPASALHCGQKARERAHHESAQGTASRNRTQPPLAAVTGSRPAGARRERWHMGARTRGRGVLSQRRSAPFRNSLRDAPSATLARSAACAPPFGELSERGSHAGGAEGVPASSGGAVGVRSGICACLDSNLAHGTRVGAHCSYTGAATTPERNSCNAAHHSPGRARANQLSSRVVVRRTTRRANTRKRAPCRAFQRCARLRSRLRAQCAA